MAETAQPKPGGTISVRQSANSPLDPHLNSTFTAQTLASYVYARLLKYKTGADPAAANNYDVEGDLAESFEVPGDGMRHARHIQRAADEKYPLASHNRSSLHLKGDGLQP